MSVAEQVSSVTTPPAKALPRGPRLPVGVQTVLFMAGRTSVLRRWQRRYGDVIPLRIAPAGPSVVLAKPEHIREVFAGPADLFHAGEGNAILGPIMGEHSVLLLDEKEHLAARKRVMAAFHGSALKSWGETIEQIAAGQIAGWPVGTAFRAHQEMNDISLEVIMRIVFGVSEGPRMERMRPLLQQVIKVGPVIFLGWIYPQLTKVGPWRRFEQVKLATDAEIYAEIAERRTAPDLAERTDVLSKLLSAAPEQGDEELRDHLITLLLAGHETTASTLAWTLHDLARKPRLLARVQRAADEGDEAYLEAVVKESMRLRPVITVVARRLTRATQVAGYELPAGVVVFPSIHLVQRTPSVWPSPEEFRPERFLGTNPPAATWIPFGGGIRRCLGASLAMIEATSVLKVVLRTVDISPVGRPEFTKTRNITSVPGRGARLVTHRR